MSDDLMEDTLKAAAKRAQHKLDSERLDAIEAWMLSQAAGHYNCHQALLVLYRENAAPCYRPGRGRTSIATDRDRLRALADDLIEEAKVKVEKV